MHCQLPCIAKQVLYSYLRTLKYRTFAYAPVLHVYKTYVTDPQSFMPASPWHSCRDAALFPNYFGQTCYASCNATPLVSPPDMIVGVGFYRDSVLFLSLFSSAIPPSPSSLNRIQPKPATSLKVSYILKCISKLWGIPFPYKLGPKSSRRLHFAKLT